MIILNNNVERFRKEINITQQEFADLLNVSRQTIISIEKGRYNPSLELAFKISKYFNKSIEDVFLYEEESE